MSRGSAVGASVCSALAVVCRVAAIALSLLVVVLALSMRLSYAFDALMTHVSTIPTALSGILVFETPTEGVFHGGLALAAVVLLVLDWVFVRTSTSLR